MLVIVAVVLAVECCRHIPVGEGKRVVQDLAQMTDDELTLYSTLHWREHSRACVNYTLI